MHRVLSLDFDGVLHPAGDGDERVDHFVWLPLLERVLRQAPDVGILVHSTWRYQYTQEELQQMLASLGPRSISVAPRGPRSEAIQWWLHLNPTVTSHLVLDDAGGEFPAPHWSELVLCHADLGITTPGVLERINAWLVGAVETSHDDRI